MKFEEWFLNNGIPLDDDFNVAKRAYEAGVSSCQEEVSKLQNEIDALQKRIDDALIVMDDCICDIDCGTIYEILEGDKND